MASSILLKFPRNTEIQTKPTDVQEALSRVRRPLDSTKLRMSVQGVYALPEVWKAKFVSFYLTPTVSKRYTFYRTTRRSRPCTPMRSTSLACACRTPKW